VSEVLDNYREGWVINLLLPANWSDEIWAASPN
jgi:hypothetical protein